MTPFEIAMKARKEMEENDRRQKDLKRSSQFTKDYEEIAWMGISSEPKVFRLLGHPWEARTQVWDSKLVYWAKILHDNQKSFVNVYYPIVNGKIDQEWILTRLYEKVKESKWIDYKDGDIIDPNRPRSNSRGYFQTMHEHTSSYKRIESNKKEGSSQFGHFYPKARVLFNVIDRTDSWCKDNKHSKLLTSNHSPFDITDAVTGSKKTIWFNDVGMPNEFYKMLYSQVLEFRNTWDLDIVLHKEDKKYILRDGMEDKIPSNLKSLISIDPLTEEESQYVKYDLDKLFRPTGYYKLFNSFESLFKLVDSELGTKFYDELVHFYEDEKVQREKERLESEKTTHPVPNVNETQTQTPTQQPISPEPRQVKREVRQSPIMGPKEKLELTPHWNKLSDSDKEEMIKYCTGVEGDLLTYKAETNLVPCSCSKKINLPDSVWTCPLDGTVFT